MKQPTMQCLIAKYIADGGPDVPLYVSSLIEQERVIRAKLTEIRREEKMELRRHELTMDAISEARRTVQDECLHYEIHYCGDPSGGSDRSETCELCGKELA